VKHKVVAYVTRQQDGRQRLLVFTHRDYPEAGVQVPAGTVEPGEAVEAALVREIREETGLTELHLKGKLAERYLPEFDETWHVFHLIAPDSLPDTWDWLTNDHADEGARERDERLVFSFLWADLSDGVNLEKPEQGWWLNQVADRMPKTSVHNYRKPELGYIWDNTRFM